MSSLSSCKQLAWAHRSSLTSLYLAVIAGMLSLLIAPGSAQETRPTDVLPSPQPHVRFRDRQSTYVGPQGETVAAQDVDHVQIVYFGPSDPKHPAGRELWAAAQQAITKANAEGGFRGKPFRLVPVWSRDPWGTGIADLAKIVYQQPVWAIIGGIDGPSTHLAEQVVAKARLPLISPVSTDKSVNLANVPWMFSIAPGDHLIAPVVAGEIQRRSQPGELVLLSSNDHDSRHLTGELRQILNRQGTVPQFQLEFQRGDRHNVASLVQRVLGSGTETVVVIADPDDSARVVNTLRKSRFAGVIFGGPAMGRPQFREQLSPHIGELVFPLLASPVTAGGCASSTGASTDGASRNGTRIRRAKSGLSGNLLEFTLQRALEDAKERDFRGSRGKPATQDTLKRELQPGASAGACTYDAVCIAVAAIRRAGLNRALVREAIVELAPWPGRSGVIRWDKLGNNDRPVMLGTIREQKSRSGFRVVPYR